MSKGFKNTLRIIAVLSLFGAAFYFEGWIGKGLGFVAGWVTWDICKSFFK